VEKATRAQSVRNARSAQPRCQGGSRGVREKCSTLVGGTDEPHDTAPIQRSTSPYRLLGFRLLGLEQGPAHTMAAQDAPKHIDEAVRLLRAAVGSNRPEEALILLQLAAARLEVTKHDLSNDATRPWLDGEPNK